MPESKCMDYQVKEFYGANYTGPSTVLSAVTHLESQESCGRGTTILHFTGEETQAQRGQVLPSYTASKSQCPGYHCHYKNIVNS